MEISMPEPRVLCASCIPWPRGGSHDEPCEGDTGRIPHRQTGSDGERRGEADRFPEASLRRPRKGTVHGSEREDPPRGGHARGLDRPIERRYWRVEAGPSAV